MAKKYLNNIGKVLKGKEGGGNYIKLDKDITLPKGAVLSIISVSENIQNLVNRGVMSQEEGDRQLSETKPYILSIVNASYEG